MTQTDLLKKIQDKLKSEGYEVKSDVKYGDYTFPVVGRLSKFELSKFGKADYFVVVGVAQEAKLSDLRSFSSQAYEYAGSNRSTSMPPGLGASFFTFPVLIVNKAEESVVEGVKNGTPPKHWSSTEFPTIVDLTTGKMHYFTGTPAWGAAYWESFRRLVNKVIPVTVG